MITTKSTALRILTLAAVIAVTASPAYAQTVGGDFGTFIQNIIDILNSSVIRGMAIIAVIITGIAWMFGNLDLRRAGTVIVSIIIIFSAAAIVDMITGGAGA